MTDSFFRLLVREDGDVGLKVYQRAAKSPTGHRILIDDLVDRNEKNNIIDDKLECIDTIGGEDIYLLLAKILLESGRGCVHNRIVL